MGLMNTLAVGLYAALFNILGAMLTTRVLPPGFAVGINVIDAALAMLATHATNNVMLIATSLLVAAVAVLAKISANATVQD